MRPDAGNARRVLDALTAFGAPTLAHGITVEDFQRPGTVYQVGLPPRRIDLLTQISGVTFEEAWSDRLGATIQGRMLQFLGRESLIRNKRSAARPKDLVDVQTLLGSNREPGSEG